MDALAGFNADLTKELAIVRALIAQNGNPVLTFETLKDAEAAQAASAAKFVVRAKHENGYVRASFLRDRADVVRTVEAMLAAGYWLHIEVTPFVPDSRRGR